VPSDLQNLTHYRISPPDNLEDWDSCREAIEEAPSLVDMLGRINQEGRFGEKRLKILSFDDVLEKERTKTKGGALRSGPVVYLVEKPIQVNFEVAQQIRDNLEYDIDYFYFLPASKSVAGNICELVQRIILADFTENDQNLATRKQMIKENRTGVEKKLKDIFKKNNLNFCFLPDKPMVFQLVLHDGLDFYKAKIFLRHGNQFVEWVEGQEASTFWKNLKMICPTLLKNGLFYRTVPFDLTGQEGSKFRNILDKEISKYFGDMNKKMKELFYEH
jgi:hypothetical protein